MTVTIYHNPRCSKSRQALQYIRDAGIEPNIIEYLKNPPTLEQIEKLYDRLKCPTPVAMVRTKEFEFKACKLSSKSNKEEILQAIAMNPILLERPIVITPKGARICRPPEAVQEIL
ncbi:MAG: arsenate reductase (glutaredoxin) [Alphaproteobacteria bacterium]|nr:arsenate reductase (glutaredoxin) [Alphaproteobacteria bacterium]